MRTLLLSLIFVFCAPPIFAQEKVADKKFIFTNVFLAGTTVFDVEATFVALNKCGVNCKELNPLMRPFVNSGRPAVYVVEGTIDVGLIALSYKLKKNGNKLWWLPPVVIGAVHGVAGGFNLRFVF